MSVEIVQLNSSLGGPSGTKAGGGGGGGGVVVFFGGGGGGEGCVVLDGVVLFCTTVPELLSTRLSFVT
jgi:hypothetical protein